MIREKRLKLGLVVDERGPQLQGLPGQVNEILSQIFETKGLEMSLSMSALTYMCTSLSSVPRTLKEGRKEGREGGR